MKTISNDQLCKKFFTALSDKYSLSPDFTLVKSVKIDTKNHFQSSIERLKKFVTPVKIQEMNDILSEELKDDDFNKNSNYVSLFKNKDNVTVKIFHSEYHYSSTPIQKDGSTTEYTTESDFEALVKLPQQATPILFSSFFDNLGERNTPDKALEYSNSGPFNSEIDYSMDSDDILDMKLIIDAFDLV